MLWLWILVSVSTLLADIVTSSFLFVWFCLGGVVAIVAYFLQYSVNVQIIAFIASGLFFMSFGYPWVKKTIKSTVKKTLTQEESYVGQEFVVEEDITDKSLIKFEGIYWTVKNEGEEMKKGDKARIVGTEGNKIIIKKI